MRMDICISSRLELGSGRASEPWMWVLCDGLVQERPWDTLPVPLSPGTEVGDKERGHSTTEVGGSAGEGAVLQHCLLLRRQIAGEFELLETEQVFGTAPSSPSLPHSFFSSCKQMQVHTTAWWRAGKKRCPLPNSCSLILLLCGRHRRPRFPLPRTLTQGGRLYR